MNSHDPISPTSLSTNQQTVGRCVVPIGVVIFDSEVSQLMVNWWFGVPRIPLMKGIGILRGTLRIPNHRDPNQQFTIDTVDGRNPAPVDR